ncbi:MAG: 3-oxoacid CoA-transferase subunit A [Clostridia bacterium]|nr:3-oxoacid CoA-transferase subunit A [Clostridia bacterium]
MNKITTARDALAHIKDGDTVMVGGFLQGGSPEHILSEMVDHPARNLTIVNNDMGRPDTNMIKVLENGRAVKLICTYIGQNATAQRMYADDPASVELNPQGTLVERIRCGGYGIPAFYTPTGVGTILAEGKESREFDGKTYLMERALHGNVGIVHAAVVDEFGNCFMKGSAKNYNAIIPQACDYCVVEAEEVVPVGAIDPELVTVSGIFIDAIVPVPKEV